MSLLDKIDKLSSQNKLKTTVFWSLIPCIHFILIHHHGFETKDSIIDALIGSSLLFTLSVTMKLVISFFHTKEVINPFSVGLLIAFSIIHVFLHQEIGLILNPESDIYPNFISAKNSIRAVMNFLILLVILHQLWIIKNRKFQQKNTAQLIDYERQLNKAELKNIQQQLQPHFLFNSLNSISALTIVAPEEAQRMVQLLSDFLRGTLRKETDALIPLEEEIKYLNLYLEIEKVRFGHRLTIDFDLTQNHQGLLIPPYILQPIVENAIKYGLYGNVGDLCIQIKTNYKDDLLEIAITNPFDAAMVEASKGTGYGLTSIQRKLQLLYQSPNLLKLSQHQNLFTTTLIIPQNIKRLTPKQNEENSNH